MKGGSKVAILLLCFLAVSVSGCLWSKRASNDTPLTNDSRILYSSVLRELAALKRAGRITDDEKKTKIEPVRQQAAFFLDQMEQAELAGDSGLITVNRANFNALLDKLIEWRNARRNQ